MGKQEQQGTQCNHVLYSRLFESCDEVCGVQLTVLKKKKKKKGRIAFLTWSLPTCVLRLGPDSGLGRGLGFGVGLRSREEKKGMDTTRVRTCGSGVALNFDFHVTSKICHGQMSQS